MLTFSQKSMGEASLILGNTFLKIKLPKTDTKLLFMFVNLWHKGYFTCLQLNEFVSKIYL